MLFLLFACQTPADCRAGFTGADDGLCYEDAVDSGSPDTDTAPEEEDPPTLDDVFDTLPACEPAATDARIDLYGGCADGVCPGATYADAVEALGVEPDCYAFYYTTDDYVGTSMDCTWPNGIALAFDDDDYDGVPDALSWTYSVSLTSSYDGGTDTGLGIGASMACFLDELGVPTSVTFTLRDEEWVPSYAYWEHAGVSVSDRYNARGSYEPDGRVDSVTMYGSDIEF